MYGVGKKTAEKLTGSGIRTIGDLAKVDVKYLCKLLGKTGMVLSQHANGYDPAPVTPHASGEMKSIGRSKTLPEDITDLEQAKAVLMELTESIGMTARKHDKKGSTVQITLKYSDFHTVTRQTTVPATYSTKEIFRAGCALLTQNWSKAKPVRLIGISLGSFEETGLSGQMSLFEFTENQVKDDKEARIDRVMDKIRLKHGLGIINRGTLIRKNNAYHDPKPGK